MSHSVFVEQLFDKTCVFNVLHFDYFGSKMKWEQNQNNERESLINH